MKNQRKYYRIVLHRIRIYLRKYTDLDYNFIRRMTFKKLVNYAHRAQFDLL